METACLSFRGAGGPWNGVFDIHGVTHGDLWRICVLLCCCGCCSLGLRPLEAVDVLSPYAMLMSDPLRHFFSGATAPLRENLWGSVLYLRNTASMLSLLTQLTTIPDLPRFRTLLSTQTYVSCGGNRFLKVLSAPYFTGEALDGLDTLDQILLAAVLRDVTGRPTAVLTWEQVPLLFRSETARRFLAQVGASPQFPFLACDEPEQSGVGSCVIWLPPGLPEILRRWTKEPAKLRFKLTPAQAFAFHITVPSDQDDRGRGMLWILKQRLQRLKPYPRLQAVLSRNPVECLPLHPSDPHRNVCTVHADCIESTLLGRICVSAV